MNETSKIQNITKAHQHTNYTASTQTLPTEIQTLPNTNSVLIKFNQQFA